jgi:hypothetical protein
LGEDEPFDYVLATRLKQSHGWVQALPHDEYVRWRAFVTWEAAQHQHAADVARARGQR